MAANIAQVRRDVAAIQGVRDCLTDDQVPFFNTFLIQVARQLTNVFQSYADKYQQDSYGYSKLSKPIPLLADLERLGTMDPDSMDYGLVETQLIKNKNRINDAMNNVLVLADAYKRVLL